MLLLNSNPATIMTDKDIADKVYIEPLTTEVVEQLIMKEKPDSVLPDPGRPGRLKPGHGAGRGRLSLQENNVRLIGTTPADHQKGRGP